MRRSFLAALVSACAALIGCGLFAGLHDLPLPSGDGSAAEDAGFCCSDGSVELDGLVALEAASVDDESDGGCACLTVPAGWTGPFALYEGPSPIPPPSCTGAYGLRSFQGQAELSEPVASCTACTCGAQQGAKCGAHFTYYTNACGGTSTGCGAEDYGALAGACEGLGTGSGGCAGRDVQSFQADGVESQAGTCAPSTVTPNGAAPSWGTTAVACAPATPFAGGSCPSGQTCAPGPAAPFDNLCVEANGAQTCPSGTPFTTPHLYYTAFDDTRACSACICSVPPAPTCSPSGTVTFWTAYTCTGTPTGSVTLNDVNASGCETLPSMSYYSTYVPTSFVLGTCSPGGGAPTGSVTPTASTAVTFCCTQ